jgi:hypothetical protein
VPSANLIRLLPLLRRKHRIQLVSGAGNNRVELGLHLPANFSNLAALPVHDGIDPDLLLGRESNLAGKPPAELAVPGGTPSGTVFKPRAAEHSGQQHQAVQSDTGDAPGEDHQQKYERGKQASPRSIRWWSMGAAHWVTASSNSQSPLSGATRCAAHWLATDPSENAAITRALSAPASAE